MINQSTADELKEQMELGQSLERLLINADFKKVIIDGYINDTLLNSEGILNTATKDDTITNIMAVNLLKDYLYRTANIAAASSDDLGDL